MGVSLGVVVGLLVSAVGSRADAATVTGLVIVALVWAGWEGWQRVRSAREGALPGDSTVRVDISAGTLDRARVAGYVGPAGVDTDILMVVDEARQSSIVGAAIDGTAAGRPNPPSRDDQPDLFFTDVVKRRGAGVSPRDVARLRSRVKEQLADPRCRILLVTGPQGAGKTGLFAALADWQPGWLRYFAQSTGNKPDSGHPDDLASFLTTIGLQIAVLWSDLDDAPPVVIDVNQSATRLDETGTLESLVINEILANPFLALAQQVRVNASLSLGTARGRVTAVDIGRVITSVHNEPQVLAFPALFEPASKLEHQHPGEILVVLVDGLDHPQPGESTVDILQWITDLPQLPANLRFVVSCRPDDRRFDELRLGHHSSLREISIQPPSTTSRPLPETEV